MAGFDPYSTLGVGRDATPEEIKKAYRNLARKYHPDHNPNDSSAEEKFKEVKKAYDILSDPSRRQQHDNFGFTGDEQPGAGGLAGLGTLVLALILAIFLKPCLAKGLAAALPKPAPAVVPM